METRKQIEMVPGCGPGWLAIFPGDFVVGGRKKLHGANLNADSTFMSLLHGATDIYLEVVHENKAKSLSWKANARVQI